MDPVSLFGYTQFNLSFLTATDTAVAFKEAGLTTSTPALDSFGDSVETSLKLHSNIVINRGNIFEDIGVDEGAFHKKVYY